MELNPQRATEFLKTMGVWKEGWLDQRFGTILFLDYLLQGGKGKLILEEEAQFLSGNEYPCLVRSLLRLRTGNSFFEEEKDCFYSRVSEREKRKTFLFEEVFIGIKR